MKYSNKFVSALVDVEQMNKSLTQEERAVKKEAQNNFLDRFRYIPLYILALVLLWMVAMVTENMGDDWLSLLQFISAPIVLFLLILRKKFQNKLIFHCLLAVLGAPIWLLLISPLILLFVAFSI